MIWTSWRQQRTETLIAVAIVALLAAMLVPTGIEMANSYRHDGLSSCLGQNTTLSCGNAIDSFTSRFRAISTLTSWFTLVPGLVAVLLAAPFVLEFENGTYRLAWTQSVTRRRWIATRLAVAIAAALLVAVAMTLLVTWWRTPLVHLNGRMDNSVFDFEGIVAAGYVLFALGLALAVGVVWRRTVPAMIVAFTVYLASRIFVDTWLRQRFEAPLTATWREPVGPPANLSHAWILSEFPSDRLGHPIALIGTCVRATATHAGTINCLVKHKPLYTHVVYQPESRFWLFQSIETAIFGGFAVALIAFAAWWTHSRTA